MSKRWSGGYGTAPGYGSFIGWEIFLYSKVPVQYGAYCGRVACMMAAMKRTGLRIFRIPAKEGLVPVWISGPCVCPGNVLRAGIASIQDRSNSTFLQVFYRFL